MKKPEIYFQHWWWIALCSLIFAGIGSLFAVVLPGNTQQSVDFQILFQPSRNINWTDKDMLSLTNQIGALIDTESIQYSVLTRLDSQGVVITQETLMHATSKERRYYGWNLTVTTNQPELTQSMLDAWQSVLMTTIDDELALSRFSRQQYQLAAAWIPCLQQLPAEPFHPFCNPNNLSAIAQTYGQIYEQFSASRTEIQFLSEFPPDFSVITINQSPIENIPAFSRSSGVGAGMLLGIILGTLTIQTPWTHALSRKRGGS